MLSFQPFYPSTHNHCYGTVSDPFESVFCRSSQPTIRRSPSVRVRVASPQHCHRPVPRSTTLFDLFDLVDAGLSTAPRPQRHHHQNPHRHQAERVQRQVQQAPKQLNPKLQVSANGVQTENSYIIQVRKDNGSNDFEHYSIYYEVRDETYLTIESKKDDYKKVYSFDNGSINLEGVTWKSTQDGLLITIPKVVEVKESPKLKGQSVPAFSQQAPTPKKISIETKRQKVESPKPKVISIPIEFGDSQHQNVPLSRSSSEKSTPSETESELSTPSASESEHSDTEEAVRKLPKLTKKASLEEVEDESLIQMDLD